MKGHLINDDAVVARALASARPDSPLGRLVREPFRFDFFQAVRLIALAAGGTQATPADSQATRHAPSGRLPYEERVRFRAHVGHAFSASTISSFAPLLTTENADLSVPEMTVTFLSLAGTGGILPGHYTQLLIDSIREKDFGLRDFWDLFNHRLIAHFYRAWEKCHFYVRYEQARRSGNDEKDHFTSMLYSLVGLGTPGLRDRQALPDDVLLYYAGHFSHRPRSATTLQQIVADCFNVPTEVRQFQGQWLPLRRVDCTQLTSGPFTRGNNRLGVSAIAGERVWGIENKIRLRVGMMGYVDFCKFLPGEEGYVALGQLVRFFAGPSLDFDIQLVLAKNETPPCQLKRDGRMRLGWNTWLLSAPPLDDVDDAVFVCDGMPSR